MTSPASCTHSSGFKGEGNERKGGKGQGHAHARISRQACMCVCYVHAYVRRRGTYLPTYVCTEDPSSHAAYFSMMYACICSYTCIRIACQYLHVSHCYVRTSICVAVTGRKRTLFHCKWANLISHISRMLH